MNQPSTETSNREDTVLCLGCTRAVPRDADFCPHCGAAIGPYCWWDPLKRIYAQGNVYRRLTGGRVRRPALVAALVLVVLFMVMMTLSMLESIRDVEPLVTSRVTTLLTYGFVLVVSGLFTYRIWKRLLGKR